MAHSATDGLLFGLRILEPDPSYCAHYESSPKMGRHGTSPATCRFIEHGDAQWSATAPRGLAY